MMPNDSEDPREWLARAEVLKAKHNNGNGAGMPLAVKLAQWPTATAEDSERSSDGNRKQGGASLTGAIKTWATPNASDNRDRGTMNNPCVARRTAIGKQIAMSMSMDGSLNPAWVESLMGFPAGWTSPLTDGPSAPVRPKGHGKRRASRKTDTSGGNG